MAPDALSRFVKAAKLVVVYASPMRPEEPDLVLTAFRHAYGAKVAWVDLGHGGALDLAAAIRWGVLRGLEHAAKGRAPDTLDLGYHLFVDGVRRGHESGVIDLRRDHVSLVAGGAASLAGLFSKNPAEWARTAAVAARVEAALRVVASFKGALDSPAARGTSPPPRPRRPPAIDPLSVAYTTLGVAAMVSRAEVKARYRALALQWHPDRHAADPAAARDAAVRMTQINEAYAIICKVRGR